MKQPVRFEGLGPSGMARRFGEADPERLEVARAVLSEAEDRQGVAAVATEAFREAAVAGWAFVKDGLVLKAEEVLAPAKEDATKVERASSGPRGGRPAKHSDKPWEAEGISRALWYRRRAGGKGGGE